MDCITYAGSTTTAKPGKVIGSMLRHNTRGLISLEDHAEQQKLDRNSNPTTHVPTQFPSSSSGCSYPRRNLVSKNEKKDVGGDSMEGPHKYIGRKVSAVPGVPSNRW